MKFTVYLSSLRGGVDGKGDVEKRFQHTKFFTLLIRQMYFAIIDGTILMPINPTIMEVQ